MKDTGDLNTFSYESVFPVYEGLIERSVREKKRVQNLLNKCELFSAKLNDRLNLVSQDKVHEMMELNRQEIMKN